MKKEVSCNHTLTHTVASCLTYVIPEQVSDIRLFPNPGRLGSLRFREVREPYADLPANTTHVTYVVTSPDPEFSFEDRSTQLLSAYDSGDMQRAFREYAVTFNVPELQYANLSRPEITNGVERPSDPSDNSDRLDTVEIIAIVIGGFFGVLIILALVWFIRRWQKY